jgi:large subunit ribosomal protein L24
MKIRKDDTVVVLSGKDKGKQGKVVRVLPDARKVVVEGVNVAKRHQKPTRSMQQGGIIDKAMPIDASNVALVVDGKPTRVGYRVDPQGQKVRVAKSTGADI